MGVWKRTLVYLGLVEEDELEEQIEPYEAPLEAPPTIRKISRAELPPDHIMAGPRPLGQVHISEPRSYDDAQEIGDKLKAGVPVVMNLQGVEDDLFKRLTSFASGGAYVLGGTVQKLAPRMYLITPANVEVSAEDRRRLAEGRGVFDEF